jgi:hypothetical protein
LAIQISAGQIHISAASNHYLTNVIGGYRTESRGEVIIKASFATYFNLSVLKK